MSKIVKFVMLAVSMLVGLALSQIALSSYPWPVNREDVLINKVDWQEVCYNYTPALFHERQVIPGVLRKVSRVILLSASNATVHFPEDIILGLMMQPRRDITLRVRESPNYVAGMIDAVHPDSTTQYTEQDLHDIIEVEDGKQKGVKIIAHSEPGKARITAYNEYNGIVNSEEFVVYVLKGVSNTSNDQRITATLGEPRGGSNITTPEWKKQAKWQTIDHFHSGVDISTGGSAGHPVYSAVDGIISHVSKRLTDNESIRINGENSNPDLSYVHIAVEWFADLLSPRSGDNVTGAWIPANTFLGVTKDLANPNWKPHFHLTEFDSAGGLDRHRNPLFGLNDATTLDDREPTLYRTFQDTQQLYSFSWKYNTKIYSNRASFLGSGEDFENAFKKRLFPDEPNSPLKVRGQVDIVVPVYDRVNSNANAVGIYDIFCEVLDADGNPFYDSGINFAEIFFNSIPYIPADPSADPDESHPKRIYPEYTPGTKRYIVTSLPEYDAGSLKSVEDGYLDTEKLPLGALGVYDIDVTVKDTSHFFTETVERIFVGDFLKLHLYGTQTDPASGLPCQGYYLNEDNVIDITCTYEMSATRTHIGLPTYPKPEQTFAEINPEREMEEEKLLPVPVDPINAIPFDSFVGDAIIIDQGQKGVPNSGKYIQFTFDKPFRASAIYLLLNATNAVEMSWVPGYLQSWMSVAMGVFPIPNTLLSLIKLSAPIPVGSSFWYPMNYTARGKLFGTVTAHYSDNSEESYELKPGVNIRNWWSGANREGYKYLPKYVFDPANKGYKEKLVYEKVVEAWRADTSKGYQVNMGQYAVDMLRIDLRHTDRLLEHIKIKAPDHMDTTHGLVPIGTAKVKAGLRLMGVTILGRIDYAPPLPSP